jgi:DNA-binding transcriptional regulator GbsR (MarR family)
MNKSEILVFEAIKVSLDRWGQSSISMLELQERTGYGRTSISKAVSSLTNSGHISVVRTKRNLGKLYKNRYSVLK